MIHLTLIRHGETDWNIQRRYQGSADQPLNSSGRAQAAALAAALTGLQVDAIYSSDLSRVSETARIALSGTDIDSEVTDGATSQTTQAMIDAIQWDERLREIDFGKFEGLTYAEIKAQYPDELATWEADRNHNAHGGERIDDVIARVTAFYDGLRQAHLTPEAHPDPQAPPQQRVLVFAHGGTIGILLALMLGADPHRWWQFRLYNTAISEVLVYDRAAILTRFNDTYHLRVLETDG